MRKALPWFSIALALVAADQLVKWLVMRHFRYGEPHEVTGFFNMVLVHNKGAAFSFLADAPGWQTPLLVGFALVAAAIVGTLIVRNPAKRLFCFGLALILGGAVGNLIDRLVYGRVIDFLDVYTHAGAFSKLMEAVGKDPCHPSYGCHWPAFNVADIAISVGVFLLATEGWFTKKVAATKAPVEGAGS